MVENDTLTEILNQKSGGDINLRDCDDDSIRRLTDDLVKDPEDIRDTVEILLFTLRDTQRQLDIANLKAYKDQLTGLYNSRFYEEFMQKEVERVKRYKTGLSIIYIDFDDFSNINSTYGHDGGDEALRDIAHVSEEVGRISDIWVRKGGDEFIIILVETDAEGAQDALKRYQEIFSSRSVPYEGKTIEYSASLGLAIFNRKTMQTAKDLEIAADTEMYRVKESSQAQRNLDTSGPKPAP